MTEILSAGRLLSAAELTAEYDYRIWGFGEGPALRALLLAGDRYGRADLVDGIARRVAPTLAAAPAETDHLIAVDVLRTLHQLRPELDVAPAIERFCHAVLTAPRPVQGRPPVHRPTAPGLETMIWVDCLHTDVPGLMLADHPGPAARLAREVCAVFQDGSGLFSHGYDVRTGRASGVHWGRGQGWALLGLAFAPADPSLDTRRSQLLSALAAWEENGHWRTVVDDHESPVENSVSALVAYGVAASLRNHPADRCWLPMAGRARAAALSALTPAGGLPVSGATPVGTKDSYLTQPVGVFPWGQGPMLLSILEGDILP